jgi:hypothetical protein
VKAVLIELVDEAKVLLRRYGRDFFLAGDTKVVCLDPKVRAFLAKQGIEAQGTERYFDNEAQHRVILKTEEWTRAMLRDMNLRDEAGIQESYQQTCAHHIGLYVGHLLWILEILKGLAEREGVGEIHGCLPEDREGMYGLEAYLQDEERFLGFLARDFSRVRGIPFRAVFIRTRNFATFLRGGVRNILRSARGMFSRWGEKSFLARKGAEDEKLIVVPALSYRMGALLAEIQERHPESAGCLIWEGKRTVRQELFALSAMLAHYAGRKRDGGVLKHWIALDVLRDRYPRDPAARSSAECEFERLAGMLREHEFRYDGVSIASYLAEKISKGLKHEILELLHTAKVLAVVLERLRPQLVLSMYSVGMTYLLGELADRMGIDTLNISHGTHVPPTNELERIENYRLARSVIANAYRHVAVQTPWTEKFLDYYGDARPRVYSGPLLFSVASPSEREKLRREILGDRRDGKIVVHASTQKSRTGFRFHITETLDEYLATLGDLVHAVNKLENVHLVIRPHPACNLSEEDFRALLPASPRTRIVAKGPFGRVLSAADLLVSFSSTCIEEALQNGIPVILYDRWRRYNHFGIREAAEPRFLTREPAYYLTRPEILSESLEKILHLFSREALRDDELAPYRYPKEYRDNFFAFVGEKLEGPEAAAEGKTTEILVREI